MASRSTKQSQQQKDDILEAAYFKDEKKVIFLWKGRIIELNIIKKSYDIEIYHERLKITSSETSIEETEDDFIIKSVAEYIKLDRDETRKLKAIHMDHKLTVSVKANKSQSGKLLSFYVPGYKEKFKLVKKGECEWINERTGEVVYDKSDRDDIRLVIRKMVVQSILNDCTVKKISTKFVIEILRSYENIKVTLINWGRDIKLRIKKNKTEEITAIIQRDDDYFWSRCVSHPHVICTPQVNYKDTVQDVAEQVISIYMDVYAIIDLDVSTFCDEFPDDKEYHLVRSMENFGTTYYLLNEDKKIKLYKEHHLDEEWVCNGFKDKDIMLLAEKVLSTLL